MRFFITLLLISLLALAACQENAANSNTSKGVTASPPKAAELTTIQWLDSIRNFGEITEGQKLEVAFRFKNTGDKPLVIYTVQPSCGCTVVDKPEKPIAPGGAGIIKGVFNSEGKPGPQHKSILVNTNTKGNMIHNLQFSLIVNSKN